LSQELGIAEDIFQDLLWGQAHEFGVGARDICDMR
jgi:hypothetical protein